MSSLKAGADCFGRAAGWSLLAQQGLELAQARVEIHMALAFLGCSLALVQRTDLATQLGEFLAVALELGIELELGA